MATKLSKEDPKAKKELKTQSNKETTQLKDQEVQKIDTNPVDYLQTQENQIHSSQSSNDLVSKKSSEDKTVSNSPESEVIQVPIITQSIIKEQINLQKIHMLYAQYLELSYISHLRKETHNETDLEKDKNEDKSKVVSRKSDNLDLKNNQNSILQKSQKNLQFYQNKIKSEPQGDFIEVILTKWKGNHKLLESHHGYVQWLFPNYFQSRFNNGASSLSRREAEEFLASKDISNRLERAYDLIYDFFGLKIKDYKTGKVVKSAQYLDRYNKTFITSFHNHMRMSRILCHQNNVGFRRYAIELVNFLEKEIYGQKGYLAFKNDTRTTQEKLKDLTAQSVPLRRLAKLDVFEEWMVYGKIHSQDKDKILKIEERCFDSWENINKESIYFAKL